MLKGCPLICFLQRSLTTPCENTLITIGKHLQLVRAQPVQLASGALKMLLLGSQKNGGGNVNKTLGCHPFMVGENDGILDPYIGLQQY